MTSFNGITVINRANRPSPISPCKLDFIWIKDGSYQNPFQVCSVHIFPNTKFGSPNPYVDLTPGAANYGLVSSTATDYIFRNYKRDDLGNRTGFNANVSAMNGANGVLNYTGGNSASAIFNPSVGNFTVILQPGAEYFPTSVLDAGANWLPVSGNSASATGDYLDIWTLVDVEGSRAQIYVNSFKLNSASVVAITEPLLVTPTNKLIQRYVEVGSREKLRVKTHLAVDNEPISDSLRNLLETGALLSNPEIRIVKLNESPELTSRVMISDFGDTTDDVQRDSQNMISYLWDTTLIVPKFNQPGTADILGGSRGVYEITVRYNILTERFYSTKFKLIVR